MLTDRGITGESSGTWAVRKGRRHILVVLRGRITEEDGRASARAFVSALGSSSGIDVVFDVREVLTYAGEARRAWQDLLIPRRAQIGVLTVVSRSRLTRMGASVFALMLGLDCRLHQEMPAEYVV